jgi:hypothetical protein
MPVQTVFTFNQGSRGVCAALAAYWIHLMQTGVSDPRERKTRLGLNARAPNGARARQNVYELACRPTQKTWQGSLHTAYKPLAPKGMQPCNPVSWLDFRTPARVALARYIDFNGAQGVLFTFSYQVFRKRQTHTVGFWKKDKTTYLFDADYGEFSGENGHDVVEHGLWANYVDQWTLKADDFGDCHWVHMRKAHG